MARIVNSPSPDLGSSPAAAPDARKEEALLVLIAELKRRSYRFVVPTPQTHRRVLGRNPVVAADLRDVFGWNRVFAPDLLGELFEPLRLAGLVVAAGALWRSGVRAASLEEDILLHSSFPTTAREAVFLGPDSYRFARLLRHELAAGRFRRAVDMGVGAGVGVLTLARWALVGELVMTDVNPAALALARVNARAAGVEVVQLRTDTLNDVHGKIDLIIANPPFIADSGRTYSDGGDLWGASAALDWTLAAVRRLARGGRLVMYTGSPIVAGADLLENAIRRSLSGESVQISYEEIDPDIFGEELDRDAYSDVDRIAAVGLVVVKI